MVFEQTWLLYSRHLDQVLLCCLYAACKVRELEGATFRAIAAQYQRQPQARPETLKSGEGCGRGRMGGVGGEECSAGSGDLGAGILQIC